MQSNTVTLRLTPEQRRVVVLALLRLAHNTDNAADADIARALVRQLRSATS